MLSDDFRRAVSVGDLVRVAIWAGEDDPYMGIVLDVGNGGCFVFHPGGNPDVWTFMWYDIAWAHIHSRFKDAVG